MNQLKSTRIRRIRTNCFIKLIISWNQKCLFSPSPKVSFFSSTRRVDKHLAGDERSESPDTGPTTPSPEGAAATLFFSISKFAVVPSGLYPKKPPTGGSLRFTPGYALRSPSGFKKFL
jgi:hypothetical protein